MNMLQKTSITGALCVMRALVDGDNISDRTIRDALSILSSAQPSYIRKKARKHAQLLCA